MKIMVEVENELTNVPPHGSVTAWLGQIFRETHNVAIAALNQSASLDKQLICLMATGLGFVAWLRGDKA